MIQRGKKSTKTDSPGIAVTGDSLIFGGYANVSMINTTTGRTIWSRRFNSDYIKPAIAGDTAFVAGSGRKNAEWDSKIKYFDINSGKRMASLQLDEGRIHGPAIANNTLFVTSDSGTVYAFTGGE
ncbi:PQQ-binding-like beta-propeller repeat protein [Natronomonas marina]|uniref:outer membrane protein assembly factor BamB family protein n=1 Tax=Natronomonas marina TaxID=2961939 RepID=UPI003D9CBAC3